MFKNFFAGFNWITKVFKIGATIGVILGGVAGLIAGVFGGMLIAPSSGKKLRSKLKENVLEKAEDAKMCSQKMRSDSIKFLNNLAEKFDTEETPTSYDDPSESEEESERSERVNFSSPKSDGYRSTLPRH